MIDNKYAKAYTEVLEIIKYFPQKDYDKIPTEKIDFFKKNMDKDYKFIINPKIDLSLQNISEETNAIIVNLFMDYYATDEQKDKIKKILELNQRKEEEQKKEKYNPDNLFKEKKKQEIDKSKITHNTDLIEYNETFFTKLKNLIFRILNIN